MSPPAPRRTSIPPPVAPAPRWAGAHPTAARPTSHDCDATMRLAVPIVQEFGRRGKRGVPFRRSTRFVVAAEGGHVAGFGRLRAGHHRSGRSHRDRTQSAHFAVRVVPAGRSQTDDALTGHVKPPRPAASAAPRRGAPGGRFLDALGRVYMKAASILPASGPAGLPCAPDRGPPGP